MDGNVNSVIDKRIDEIVKKNNIFHLGKVTKINNYIIEASGLDNAFFFEKVVIGSEENIGYIEKIDESKVYISLVKTDGKITIDKAVNGTYVIVAVLDGEQTRIVGNRYQRIIPIDVHYFPSEKAKNKELHSVAQVLYGILERITLADGTMLNGFQMSDKPVNGVLHFFVTYKPILTYQTAEETNMGEVAVNAKAVD